MIERCIHITFITTRNWFVPDNRLSVMSLIRGRGPDWALTQLLKRVFTHSQIIELNSTVLSTRSLQKFAFVGYLDIVKTQTQPN